MKRIAARGFTFLEVLVFVIVTGILLTTIMLGAVTAMRNTPAIHNQWIAIQTARRCLEYFIEQNSMNGNSAITCPSTPSPSVCAAPAGFTVSTSVTCTTWNSDNTYKTITVTVGGLASTALSTQIGKSTS